MVMISKHFDNSSENNEFLNLFCQLIFMVQSVFSKWVYISIVSDLLTVIASQNNIPIKGPEPSDHHDIQIIKINFSW